MATLDGDNFLSVNGAQVLSHACVNLLGDLPDLARAGVRALRLSPQHCDMVKVARIFRDVLDGREDCDAAGHVLSTLYPKVPFANGFLHGVSGAELVSASSGRRA